METCREIPIVWIIFDYILLHSTLTTRTYSRVVRAVRYTRSVKFGSFMFHVSDTSNATRHASEAAVYGINFRRRVVRAPLVQSTSSMVISPSSLPPVDARAPSPA